jgi:hypothetical protein
MKTLTESSKSQILEFCAHEYEEVAFEKWGNALVVVVLIYLILGSDY